MLPTIRFQFPGDISPEEKETIETIRDCLQHVFRGFKSCRHGDPVDIWVKGDHLDYMFIAEVCCRSMKKRVERLFDDLNCKLAGSKVLISLTNRQHLSFYQIQRADNPAGFTATGTP